MSEEVEVVIEAEDAGRTLVEQAEIERAARQELVIAAKPVTEPVVEVKPVKKGWGRKDATDAARKKVKVKAKTAKTARKKAKAKAAPKRKTGVKPKRKAASKVKA
ncbi:MAG: hypothetical protein IPO08_23770 [Xanthomonadales bacterium]|nr:hypothetical protein [Xanthomonadales bacterium]